MFELFNPGNVVSVFIAAVLGFEAAPRFAVVSKTAGLFMKLAAGALALSAASGFVLPFLYRFMDVLPALPFEPWQMIGLTVGLAFWGFLAAAVWALVEAAPKKPELR